MAKELTLNPAKLRRLVKHLNEGGAATTEEAERVLRIRKPEFVKAYLEEATNQSSPGTADAPTEDTPVEKSTSEPPAEQADTSSPAPKPQEGSGEQSEVANEDPGEDDECKRECCKDKQPATQATKLARFVTKDGQTIKLAVKQETDKAIIYEEDVPKEMVTIMIKGAPAQVNALDDTLSPDIRQAVELARA